MKGPVAEKCYRCHNPYDAVPPNSQGGVGGGPHGREVGLDLVLHEAAVPAAAAAATPG